MQAICPQEDEPLGSNSVPKIVIEVAGPTH